MKVQGWRAHLSGPRVVLCAAPLALVPCLLAARGQDAAGQRPVFRSAVELIAVDVQVLNHDGDPLSNLTPADFSVTINGHARKVVSATFNEYATGPRDLTADPGNVSYTPGLVSDNAPAPPRGRIFIVAIDNTSFSLAGMKVAVHAAQRFVQEMQPEDLAGVFAYPIGPERIDLLHDHFAIERAINGIQGLKQPTQSMSDYNLSPSEIEAITAGDATAYEAVFARQCHGDPQPSACRMAIRGQASELAGYLEAQDAASLRKLERLFESLSELPYRKTVVVVSGGLASANRVGGRPDVSSQTKAIGEIAAAAGVNLYIVHMDSSREDSMAAVGLHPYYSGPDANPAFDPAASSINDTQTQEHGLDQLAGHAGGTLFTVPAGQGDLVFDRVLRETRAYYLLGVQPDDLDRDGKLHFMDVKVSAPGATVRSRPEVIVPKKSN